MAKIKTHEIDYYQKFLEYNVAQLIRIIYFCNANKNR